MIMTLRDSSPSEARGDLPGRLELVKVGEQRHHQDRNLSNSRGVAADQCHQTECRQCQEQQGPNRGCHCWTSLRWIVGENGVSTSWRLRRHPEADDENIGLASGYAEPSALFSEQFRWRMGMVPAVHGRTGTIPTSRVTWTTRKPS